MAEDECPHCRYLRKLAAARGTTFDKTQCIHCVPPGPRRKIMALYVVCGVVLAIMLFMLLGPLPVGR
jgi:hypothetical protein